MSRADEVKHFTEGRLKWLSGLPENRRKAVLSQLRHGVGKSPEESPKTWGILMLDMPDAWLHEDGKVSYEEKAVYDALTLYALHMQSVDSASRSMYDPECRVGSAIAKLATDKDEEERIRKRFVILLSASNEDGFAYYLREMIPRLSKAGIGLDYGMLASDLYRACFTDNIPTVSFSWGQDYYRTLTHSKEGNSNAQN